MQESSRNRAAAEAAAAPRLDLDDRRIHLTGWEGIQIGFFTHVPYVTLVTRLHLHFEWAAPMLMLYVTHRFASADREHFTRSALVAGIGSAVFCVALQLLLGPHTK
jgi:hypothetical protein